MSQPSKEALLVYPNDSSDELNNKRDEMLLPVSDTEIEFGRVLEFWLTILKVCNQIYHILIRVPTAFSFYFKK